MPRVTAATRNSRAILLGSGRRRFDCAKVKENVYMPDWTSPERVEYTKLLFDLLARFTPEGVEASVSTLPASFKGFPLRGEDLKKIRDNLWHCVEHIARLSQQTG